MAAIHNQAGTDFLEVNPDGSININLAVSSSNPLPITTTQLPTALGSKRTQESVSITNAIGTSTAQELMLGRLHSIKISQAAVAAQYARVQIYNPVGSGVELMILAINSFAGTAGSHVYSAYAVNIATDLGAAATTSNDVNFRLGGAVIPNIQLLGRNSATAITTTNLVDIASHASITSPGTAITLSSGLILIPEGQCLEFAIGTLNVAINIVVALYAMPT